MTPPYIRTAGDVKGGEADNRRDERARFKKSNGAASDENGRSRQIPIIGKPMSIRHFPGIAHGQT
jgi:hypothetical protein